MDPVDDQQHQQDQQQQEQDQQQQDQQHEQDKEQEVQQEEQQEQEQEQQQEHQHQQQEKQEAEIENKIQSQNSQSEEPTNLKDISHVYSEQLSSISQPIDIVVQDPQIKQDGQFSKFTLYLIKGRDRAGNFEVQRRFNEFYAIREALIIRWPGCIVPRLPGKKMFSGNEKKVVDDRLKFLNAFCAKVAKLHHLFYSTEFNQVFLRSKDSDVTKNLSSITKNSTQEVIQKYQVHFGQLQGRDIDQNLIQSLETFTSYVKKSLETLKNYKVFVKEVVDNQEQLNQSLTYTLQTQLPDYEKKLLSQYVGGNEESLLFANPANMEVLEKKFHFTDTFRANNLQIFLDLIRLEIKDCKAFLQQVQIREDFEKKKIMLEMKSRDLQNEFQSNAQGKHSLKSMFSKGTSEEYKQRIQAQMQEINIEIQNTKLLLDIISAILGFIEIDNFKRDKQTTYQSIMSMVCDLEIESIQQQMKVWEFLQMKSASLLEQTNR